MRYSHSPITVASTLWLTGAMACTVPAGPAREATVFYASGADLQSINPLVAVHPLAKAVQKHLLFLTLARYDARLQPVPGLARWEWKDDRRVLEFHLRSDVTWHDGVPTRAADVVWTLTMARHPDVAYPRVRDLASIEAVDQVDSLTVRVRFTHAQPGFPDVLTDLAVLPVHRFEGVSPRGIRRAPFNAAPVGNGPFAFVEYRPNQRWVFRRVDGFPASLGRPAIERFVIAVVDEPSTKLAALTSGEVDFAGITAAHARFVRRDPALRVVDYPMIFSYALVWNLRREPFDDVRVRRALTMALDRQSIVDATLYGFGTPAHGPVPSEHPWFEPTTEVPYDLPAARRALTAAGWEPGPDGVRRREGRRLAFQVVTVGSGDNVLEQMIQAQLRSVGAAVTIRQLELTTFLSAAQSEARDFDALVTGIPGDLALSHVPAMFDGTAPGPLAYPGYRSARFDEAMVTIRNATTELDLEAGWRRVQRILAVELPTSWLYHARGVQGVNNRIQSEAPDLRGELAGVSEWTIEQRGGRR